MQATALKERQDLIVHIFKGFVNSTIKQDRVIFPQLIYINVLEVNQLFLYFYLSIADFIEWDKDFSVKEVLIGEKRESVLLKDLRIGIRKLFLI